ncbi:hypothetical protein [Enterovibrio paralichthyis]|uniref:hypothetical protein n=1 Tax=Enterovibrio paralichthyis TaxID=2853805 RepID=UPI001C48025C|nr:hypothetical protein [Enterovibrio paralichthyis]MBV7300216.1 hypothetical protein [Enterovibrio paralichthyis]
MDKDQALSEVNKMAEQLSLTDLAIVTERLNVQFKKRQQRYQRIMARTKAALDIKSEQGVIDVIRELTMEGRK